MAKLKELKGIKKTEQYLTNLFKAKFPFIYIPTWEEIRIITLISKIANDEEQIKTKREVFIWSSTEGLKKKLVEGHESINIRNPESPIEALNYIENYNKPSILILKDIHYMLGVQNRMADYNFIRRIRDLSASLKNSAEPKNVVMISPTLVLPVELQKDVTVVDFELPTLDEIKSLLDEMVAMNQNTKIKISLSENDKEKLCKAAQGLTLQEAENAFARAMVTNGQLTINELDIILQEKCQVIKKTGILEFVNTNLKIDDIGGLENLKRWLSKRNNSWLGKAQKEYNLPAPKGVLITGVAGCGKSMTAKAMSAMWKLPLLRLDIGRIFSGLVGSSEENMRKAIQTAEAVAPSILWIDEIEKGFGNSSGELDGGTSTRVFGTFLTWMNEKTKPVFVIATANNISKLPPEMLRKGRFDEIFFVDLPIADERKIIFKLHLEKKLTDSKSSGFEVTDDLLNRLVRETEGFGGSEIEQVVISALFEAFAEDRTLKEEDLFRVIRNTIPLSMTQSEQIIAIRAWANERAVSATAHNEEYNYSSDDSQDLEKKEKQKQKTETVKRNRGGRTIDF